MIKDLDVLLGLGSISAIYTKNITLNEPFITFAGRFADEFGTVILLSDNSSYDCGRYNILGYNPWLWFCGKDQNMSITINGKTTEFKADPFDTLRYLLKIYDMGSFKDDIPISSGLMGYLSYDLKNSLEKLPLTTIDDACLPELCFFIPSVIVVNDTLKDTVQLFVSSNKDATINQKDAVKNFDKKLESSLYAEGNFSIGNKGYKSNISHSEYINAVKKIKCYISKGHVYQVNLSQRFEAEFTGSEFSFFKALYDINPAPFFAYVNAINHQIISTSPERLIMQRGENVETRPIKGTRPRGKTLEVDKLMKNELLTSQKDDAELSMIVDLLRNDLGKVCKSDSINVCKHKKLEAYQNVYHLVSIIKGKLEDSKNSVDLIKAIFPGGSITGCPKIRSMEIIDELEANCRHVYTGSIGYISFHKTMDLSVAIRTATIVNNSIRFSVGGGIVYDSDPEEEFNETLHKGKTIMKFFDDRIQIGTCFDNKISYVWINGILKPSNEANIPINDLGVMYGFGLFETLLVKNGQIYLLKEHIERLNASWKKLFRTPTPNLTWREIILQVIEANGLNEYSSVVKIMVTRGENNDKKNLFSGVILVTAKFYKSRLSDKKRGFKVKIYPTPRQTPLAAHKTLNYLYYYFAGLWAANHGFDEAIILNPDGTISEGNSSNIFLIYDRVAIVPESEFVLKGVMAYAVRNQLKEMNYNIVERPVKQSELFEADSIFLTNSLIGMVPVTFVNNRLVNSELKLAKIINERILQIAI